MDYDLTIHEVNRQPWMTDKEYAWAQQAAATTPAEPIDPMPNDLG